MRRLVGPRSQRTIIREWSKEITSVCRELTTLLGHRLMYQNVLGLVRGNPEIQKASSFYGWMRAQYSTYMAIGIRRLVDHDRRTLSLLRLLRKIRRSPGVLSAKRHGHLYKRAGLRGEIGGREFAEYARKDGEHLNLRILQTDITVVRRTAERIKRYVDKHVAHTDRIRLRRLPTFKMVDVTLDTLKEVAERYRILITGKGGDLTPTYLDDWAAIFEVAWVRRA